jgi:RNA polymerase sigma-70 factor (ECF subfamily)
MTIAAREAPLTAARAEQLAPDFDEHAAVEAAKLGEQEALGQLYEHYFPRIYRYVVSRLRSNEDAEDVTEEVFLRIIDNIGSFEWRGLPFGAWVFRIARNEVVSHVRRQKSRGSNAQLTESIPDEGRDHTELVEIDLTFKVVQVAIEQLPEAQRQVVSLRFVAGLTVAETAQTLKKTENNVKVLQHKAIARLQQLMGQA